MTRNERHDEKMGRMGRRMLQKEQNQLTPRIEHIHDLKWGKKRCA